MNKKLSFSTLLLLLVLFMNCGQKVQVQETQNQIKYQFNTDSLLIRVKNLSSDAFEGRRTGTKGAEKAKQYILTRYKTYNLLPFENSFEQAFSFESRGTAYNGVNLIGYIKGTSTPDDYIVISAHYDHEGIKKGKIYNGADDDASGVSALFAFAEYFEHNPPKHSVIIAAFDAEELGLSGSKFFVDNSMVPLEQIKLNINMDMIGRNDKNELYVSGTSYNQSLKNIITNFRAPAELSLLMGHDGQDGLQDWTYSSDHGPFHTKNIPFLYFGEEDHKDYHQPTDDYENIQPKFYITAVETIITVFSIVDPLKL